MKVEMDVLGSPSLMVRAVSVDVKQLDFNVPSTAQGHLRTKSCKDT